MFNHSEQTLRDVCAQAIELAKAGGATAAEADVSESIGQSVQVRLQEIEHIEYQQDKSLDLTVYVGRRKGRASTADFSPAAIADTMRAALDIARYTAEDSCAGLAEAALMATEFPDLQSYHEWPLSTAEAAELARRSEAAARAADSRITNSEGAHIQTGHYQYVYGNSHGFMQHQRSSRHSLSCSVVAGSGSGMQRDYWYDLARSSADLDTPEHIGQTAARKLTPQQAPWLYQAGTTHQQYRITIRDLQGRETVLVQDTAIPPEQKQAILQLWRSRGGSR